MLSKLESLGYQRTGDIAAIDDPSSVDLFPSVTQVRATAGDVVLGRDDAQLKWVTDDGKTVADLPQVASVADCLGNPALATIQQDGPDDSDAVGVGVSPTSPDDESEVVICAPGDQERADQIIDMLANEEPSMSGRPYAEVFQDWQATVSDGMVRITMVMPKLGPGSAFAYFPLNPLPKP